MLKAEITIFRPNSVKSTGVQINDEIPKKECLRKLINFEKTSFNELGALEGFLISEDENIFNYKISAIYKVIEIIQKAEGDKSIILLDSKFNPYQSQLDTYIDELLNNKIIRFNITQLILNKEKAEKNKSWYMLSEVPNTLLEQLLGRLQYLKYDVLIFKDDTKYQGKFDKNGNGEGKKICSDGETEIGNFKNGKLDGYGERKFRNRNGTWYYYIGNFVDGFIQGQGILYSTNSFKDLYQKGLKGKGKYCEVYVEPKFLENSIVEIAVSTKNAEKGVELFKLSNKNTVKEVELFRLSELNWNFKFIGEFKNNFNVQGILYFNDDNLEKKVTNPENFTTNIHFPISNYMNEEQNKINFKGTFVNRQLQGTLTITEDDGLFNHLKVKGKGTLTLDEIKIPKNILEGKYTGKGRIIYDVSEDRFVESYEGDILNGIPHGNGKYIFSDSKENRLYSFEGNFVDGEPDPDKDGKFTFNDGKEVQANYNNFRPKRLAEIKAKIKAEVDALKAEVDALNAKIRLL